MKKKVTNLRLAKETIAHLTALPAGAHVAPPDDDSGLFICQPQSTASVQWTCPIGV